MPLIPGQVTGNVEVGCFASNGACKYYLCISHHSCPGEAVLYSHLEPVGIYLLVSDLELSYSPSFMWSYRKLLIKLVWNRLYPSCGSRICRMSTLFTAPPLVPGFLEFGESLGCFEDLCDVLPDCGGVLGLCLFHVLELLLDWLVLLILLEDLLSVQR